MDPIESSYRWHEWVVRGSAEVLAKTQDALNTALPLGWKRLRGDELKTYQTPVKPGSDWYAIESTPTHAGATLSIVRIGDGELRGGRVWFAALPFPDGSARISAAWDEITRFLDEGIVPAARAAGALVRVPAAGDLFVAELPSDIAERLRKFSSSARKSIPLGREESALWDDFVVAAFRSRSVVESRQLANWLAVGGWPRGAAEDLSRKFSEQCSLLSRYADEVSAA